MQVTIKNEAEEITSASGKHLQPERIDFKIAPLVNQNTAKHVKIIGIIMLSLLAAALIITFVLALFFQGSLLTTWLCINTIQLLAHIPLIQAKLPANAHYFFLNLLCMVRLNFASFNDSVSVEDLNSSILESKLIHDDHAYYSSLLHNFGYRFSFAYNMLLIACAALLLTLVWAFTKILDHLRPLSASRRKTMTNFMARFALEAHFELMICAFITLSNPGATGSIYWLISLASIIASTITIAVLVHHTFKIEHLSDKISSSSKAVVDGQQTTTKVEDEVA